MRLLTSLVLPAVAGLALAVAFAGGTVLADTKAKSVQMQSKTLKTVAPGRGRLITGSMKLTAGGGLETVCCTNWNTSTGGTGCSSVEGECPAGQFKVECGADGCW